MFYNNPDTYATVQFVSNGKKVTYLSTSLRCTVFECPVVGVSEIFFYWGRCDVEIKFHWC